MAILTTEVSELLRMAASKFQGYAVKGTVGDFINSHSICLSGNIFTLSKYSILL